MRGRAALWPAMQAPWRMWARQVKLQGLGAVWGHALGVLAVCAKSAIPRRCSIEAIASSRATEPAVMCNNFRLIYSGRVILLNVALLTTALRTCCLFVLLQILVPVLLFCTVA